MKAILNFKPEEGKMLSMYNYSQKNVSKKYCENKNAM